MRSGSFSTTRTAFPRVSPRNDLCYARVFVGLYVYSSFCCHSTGGVVLSVVNYSIRRIFRNNCRGRKQEHKDGDFMLLHRVYSFVHFYDGIQLGATGADSAWTSARAGRRRTGRDDAGRPVDADRPRTTPSPRRSSVVVACGAAGSACGAGSRLGDDAATWSDVRRSADCAGGSATPTAAEWSGRGTGSVSAPALRPLPARGREPSSCEQATVHRFSITTCFISNLFIGGGRHFRSFCHTQIAPFSSHFFESTPLLC